MNCQKQKNIHNLLIFLVGFFLFSSLAMAQGTEGLVENEVSWAWYISRATGLLGFTLLYFSIVSGLAVRIPFLGKKISFFDLPVSFHGWLSLQAFVFSFIHGLVLIFDRFLNFSWADILVPFHFSTTEFVNSTFLALGIIALYLMGLLVATSYARKYINQKLWRVIHFFNIIIYGFGLAHALRLGTDLKILSIRSIFIGLNLLIPVLVVWHIMERIKQYKKAKNLSLPNENIR